MQHILIATDGSSGAERAMEVAAQLAKAMGARLSILTVGGNLTADEMRQLERAEGSLGDALEGLSKQILWHAAECAKRVGVSTIHTHSAWGDPAEEIIGAAHREEVDAIVLGRRGRGRLAGLLLGSVSQKVASLAPCVVIVVRREMRSKKMHERILVALDGSDTSNLAARGRLRAYLAAIATYVIVQPLPALLGAAAMATARRAPESRMRP